MTVGGWLGWQTDEGRDKQRYSLGRRMKPLIRGCPNGTSSHGLIPHVAPVSQLEWERSELKHLSKSRKRKQ